jgi:hypothetical protein
MDKPVGDDLVLARALEALQAYGIKAKVIARAPKVGTTRPYAVVTIGRNARPKHYAAEVKRNIHPAVIGTVRRLAALRKEPTLLVADYVAPALADKLKENDLAFVDTAGNAYFNHPDLFVWTKGNRPRFPTVAELKKQYGARVFEPAGLKVLFAFLCDPKLVDRPFRNIANVANVAHGTVGEVMAELTHRGYVYAFGKGATGRKLRDLPELLDKWAEAYARKLKPKQFLGRYRARNPLWWENLDATKYGMVLGAEPAAARITGYLRPALITLYGDHVEPRLMVDHVLRADPQGDVEIAQRFWRVETEEDKKGLAPLPLIYADLLATADPRCIETAGLIRENFLDRLKQQA